MRKTLFLLLLLAALAGCGQPAAPEKAGPRQSITVAYTFQPQSTLVHIAVNQGLFAAQGLDVHSVMHTYGKAALQSVIDRQADFATVAETPVVFSVLRGDRIFIIANIEASSTNNAVVARRSAGIPTPGALKGKRIGFTPGTTSEFFLDTLLTANGLGRGDIRPVPLKPEDMLDAVMAGKVDAASTWNYPLTQIKRRLGDDGTIFYDREIYTETFNIAAREDFVGKHPETVKRFLRALIAAEEFVAKHPAEAQAIMAAAANIEVDLVREVWNAFNYRVLQDQNLLITLEDETRWAMKHKLTDQTAMPDYLSHIHLDSLRSVKPDAITMSR